MKITPVPLFTAAMLASSIAQAAPVTVDGASITGISAEGNHLGVGATSSWNERPFVGVDPQQESLPYLSLQYGHFAVEGLDATLSAWQSGQQGAGLIATPRFYEFKTGFADDGDLDGMESTDDTWFGGAYYRVSAGSFRITASALYDIGNESDGTEVTLTGSRTYKKGIVYMVPAAGLVWQDEDLVDHFYGVSPEEARAGRPAYGGEDAVNLQGTFTTVWQAHRHWRLLAALKVQTLGSGIGDSPIVEEDTLTSGLVGFVYDF